MEGTTNVEGKIWLVLLALFVADQGSDLESTPQCEYLSVGGRCMRVVSFVILQLTCDISVVSIRVAVPFLVLEKEN